MSEQDFWTKDRAQLLRTMVADGKSVAEMAETLGCTRNAVIGKYRRMGLRVFKVERKPALPPLVKLHTTPRESASRPGFVEIVDLKAFQCRWPTSDGPPTLFCGLPADGPYCESHTALAYTTRRSLRSPTYTWGRRG